MLEIKRLRGDYDKLIRDLEGFMVERINLDPENITLLCLEHGAEQKKGKTNIA